MQRRRLLQRRSRAPRAHIRPQLQRVHRPAARRTRQGRQIPIHRIAGKNPALRAHRQDHRFSGRHRRHRQQGCDDRQSPRNERPGVVPVGEDRTRQMGSTRGAQRPT